MDNQTEKYKIWVEMDEYDDKEADDTDEDYCNATVSFIELNCQLSLNIWSEKFFNQTVDKIDWLNDSLGVLPDIVLKKVNSLSVREAIKNLIDKHKWFEGRGFPYKESN